MADIVLTDITGASRAYSSISTITLPTTSSSSQIFEIPKVLEDKSVSISQAGTTIINPDSGYDAMTSVDVTIQAGSLHTPTISVNDNGLISVSAQTDSGYINATSSTSTYQLNTQSGYYAFPSSTNILAVDKGKFTTGSVYVQGDANLTSSNIISGVSIFGVSGTYSGIIPSGNLVISDTNSKNVEAFATAQVVDSNLMASNIVSGVSILGVSGTYSGIIPSGKSSISDILEHDVSAFATAQVVDSNLIASNIVSGVSILGVSGTYSGITPSGVKYLYTAGVTQDVSHYYYAYIPPNYVPASRIQSGYTILGISGTYSGIIPSGSISLTNAASSYDVTSFSEAHIYDENLIAANIAKDVNVLGITGTHEGGGGGGGEALNGIIEGNLSGELSCSAKSIRSSMFTSTELTSVYFPSCSYINIAAFYSCSMLVEASFPVCTYIGDNAFYSCSALITASFPACSYIGNYVFYNCSSLTTSSFASCMYIGSYAFANCSSLSEINFPICQLVCSNAFRFCTSLKSVSLPFCTQINSYAFSNCSELTEVTFKAFNIAVSSQSKLFYGCNNLQSIYVLSDCLSVYQKKLSSWSSKLVTINNDGSFIYPYEYANTTEVQIDWSKIYARKVGQYAFYNCSYLASASLSNCTYIGSYAFYSCTSLSMASFPSCTYIGYNGFYGCSSLASISFPVCTYIGSYAFGSCSSLSIASFPSCTYIDDGAFSGCTSLYSLYLFASSMCILSTSMAFYDTPLSLYWYETPGNIYVPSSLLTAYQTNSVWSVFSTKFIGV